MKKTALMLLATVLLLTGTVHPDPVQAGTVTVTNMNFSIPDLPPWGTFAFEEK